MTETILWGRLDRPGHEFCRLQPVNGGWMLAGTAVFAFDETPCLLNYRVRCDGDWQTRAAAIDGYVGSREVDLHVTVSDDRRWKLNDADCPAVAGCVDLDLGFSPATNLLPIRRLAPGVGEGISVRAAWLPFPGFVFEALPQVYHRTAAASYRYESRGGTFVRALEVNEAGWVTSYPGLWRAEVED